MATIDNLQAAFAGESQANRKYLAFAKKAASEGFPGIAHLFRATAEAETIHALMHFRVMNGVKGTEENLKAAIAGEFYEYTDMYPTFLAAAEAEGNKPAIMAFKSALAVETIHHGLYSNALETFKVGKDLPNQKIYICPVCGNTVVGEAPDKCPICNAPKDKWFEVQ